MKNINWKVWKPRTDIVQTVIIGVLVLVVLLNNFSLVAQFLGKLNPLASYQKRLEHAEQRNVILEFDRVRLEDATNILLAIQDYYFQRNTPPESLENLKNDGYLDPNSRLIDPSTNQPYFYQKREQDLVLCIWLSDMLKGVNTTSCPSSNSEETPTIEQNKTVTPIENKTAELEIIGNATFVNVRAEPNTISDIIAKVNLGDTFAFEDTKDNWYKITVTAEKIGWVFGDYVKVLKSL